MSFFRRRLALVMTVLPLACYAYACSSDDPTLPFSEDEDAGERDGGGTADKDSGSPVDSGGKTDSGSDDAGDDGGPVDLECIGNPLIADGGSPDAGSVVIPFASLKAIATGPFLDGPQFINDGTDAGAIVYSEVYSQAIVRNAPDGGARVVLRLTGNGNIPIGNAHVDNFIYTTLARTSGGGGILRMLVDGGSPTGFDGGPANSPNDLVASSKGFVYFTDPNYQAGGPSTGVYRMAPDGGVTTITTLTPGNVNRADGIALTQDGTTLYVGFFDQGRISKYTVDASGVASNPQNFPFAPTNQPTGLAVDVAGNLWIAENSNAALEGLIEIVSPTGKKWGEIPFPDSRPTGIAFGGPDNKTAYITTERDNVDGTLYVLPTRCAGVR